MDLFLSGTQWNILYRSQGSTERGEQGGNQHGVDEIIQGDDDDDDNYPGNHIGVEEEDKKA